VDVHTHYIPPEVVADARAGGGFDGLRVERRGAEEWLIHRQGYRYPLHRSFYDLPTRLRSMDERGIDHAVLSIAPTMLMYWTEPAAATAFCRLANDSLARFCRDSQGRTRAVATLPLQDPGAAVAELHRAVGELSMCGALIGPTVEGTPLDDPALRPVLAAAAELGVPLIVHPYFVGSLPGLADFYLTNLVGNPMASTVCAARLILSGLLDEIEELRIVLMHGGGFLPYQIGRLDHGHRVRPEARGCRRDPSHYLSRFWFDTVLHDARPLRYLVDLVGADHVLFGTDFPFDMADRPPSEQLDAVGLDPDGWARVAGGNTMELFAGCRTP
jgi:aminocarboxymuconate-semialdehyde decarboxylase